MPGRKKGDGLGKFGGRKPGTPNKITAEVRELLSKFVESRWDDFMYNYDRIESPKDKCYIMVSLLPFIAPKLQNVEYKGDVPVKTLADELDEISGEKTRK